MYKILICSLIFSFGFLIQVHGQLFDVLQVNDEFTDEELIEDVFLKGFCGNVSNIEAVGESFSVGHFFNGDDIIGIDKGIIISCGDIRAASQPNSDTETTTIIGTSGDKDLSIIATAAVFDASGISFDFVPLGNRVSFNYVFASEEYCEWVGTEFNDVFGFFVSGPGIDGEFSNNGINVARLPGSDEFVSINTVNHRTNQELYVKNELAADATRCAIPFAPRFDENIEFDGFTLPLKAEFDVVPCETYTIRLIVGDVNDELYDSAVFLEMNSFDIGGNLRITASSESSSDTLVSESCTNGFFTFERVQVDIDLQQTFDIGLNPSSTATEGLDFEPIPSQITFNPGDLTVEVPINIIADDNREDQETISLILGSGCECVNEKRATLVINDDIFFDAAFDELDACSNQDFIIEPIINGGAPPYSYKWNDGSEERTIETVLNNSTDFSIVITDFCGRQTSASTRIDLKEVPSANIGGDYMVCNGIDKNIEVSLEGSPPWNLSYQINLESPIEIIEITSQPFLIPATTSGEIRLLEFSDINCTGNISGTANVIREDLEIEINMVAPTCPNTFDGALSFDLISPSPTAFVNWFPMVNDELSPTELQAGTYLLVLEDERGCVLEENITLESSNSNPNFCEDLNVFIPNIYSPNGDGNNDDFIIQLEHEPQIVSVASFSIYDRWGNRIFEKRNFMPTDNNIEFDADFRNKKLFPGVFGYVATFNLLGEVTRSISGTITVIR